jgi:pectinesterase
MLDLLPEDHPKRNDLIVILQQLIEAVCRYQDDREGLWYQVLDKGDREDNWLELSCSTLFVYMMAKSVLKGYVSDAYLAPIRKGYSGVLNRIGFDPQGHIQIPDICIGTGVGDYAHYIGRERCTNDLHGVATFVHMCMAMEELERTVSPPSGLKPDAIVDSRLAVTDYSERYGCKVFPTIQSALDETPSDAGAAFVILIKNGRYHEKLTVDKPYITFLGENREHTVITCDIASDTRRPDGTTYGTYESATVTVAARHFTAIGLTIENSFDYPANRAKPEEDPTRFANPQAVALKTDRGSMNASFIHCKLLGYQDTLFANSGTQYYYQCHVEGHIDFIFGAGQAVFEDCDIVSLDMGSATDNGYITAASTSLSSDFGFLFTGCRLLKGSPGLADGTVALGRPWHPTSDLPDGTRAADPLAVGSVLFANCDMDSHILEKGWESMHGWDKDRNEIRFYPEDARFYEYANKGPGANLHPSRRQLSGQPLEDYSPVRVLNGWIPNKSGGR